MIIKHKIGMELDRVDLDKEIYVVQDDKYSRELEIHLKANGKEYYPPEDCTVLVRYEKPDGRGGAYDVLPDGRKAAEICGNVVTVGLAPQVCTVAGRVMLTVTLRHQADRGTDYPRRPAPLRRRRAAGHRRGRRL